MNDIDRLIRTYGKDLILSKVKNYNIVHLDDPTDQQIKDRIKEVEKDFIDDELDDDCPLCKMMKNKPCDIVYYKQM
ncbi:MAG: hypothetical protein P9L90_05190 [Candidatus Aadella gelida]|nr:hypothetical protein [Candidatus Aadella gelida]